MQSYAPKILDKLKWYWKPTLGYSWRVDEKYIWVKDEWAYLYSLWREIGYGEGLSLNFKF